MSRQIDEILSGLSSNEEGLWCSFFENISQEEEVNLYIKPFGKGDTLMEGLNEINLDVVKTGNYTCSFSEAPKVKKLKKPKKQKSGAQKLLEKITGN